MLKKFSNTGISLISLIITIIVIIILAAIVIFSGMGTPEKAQLSKVISDIDNVQTAVDQAYYGLYTEKAVAGEVWTKSQFYEAVATGKTNRDELNSTGLVEIAGNSLVKINLPKYEGRKWYIAVSDVSDTVKTGSAVLSPGFESDGKVYATLLDVQNGGGNGSGLNGGNAGSLTESEKAFLNDLEIGDTVPYTEIDGYPNVVWKVIDKDDSGIVTLTTSDAIGSVTLFGAEGYINGIDTLNNECLQYATPDAIEVRCMNLEDLKKLCKRFQSPDDQDLIESLEKMDIEEYVQLYTGSSSYHGRYAFYSTDTPSDEIENITVNGATYYAEICDGIFLTYDDENGVTHTATSFTSGEGGYKEPKYNSVTGKAEPVLVSVDKTFLPCAEEVGEIIGDRSFILATRYVCPAQQGGDFGMLGCFGAVDMWNFLYSSDEYEDISIESPYHPIVKISVKTLQNPIYQIRVGDFVNYIDEGTPAELQGNWRVLEKGNDGTIKLYLDSCKTNNSINGWNYDLEYYLGVTRCVTININQLIFDTCISLDLIAPIHFQRNNDIYTVWKTIDSNYELDLIGNDCYYICVAPR